MNRWGDDDDWKDDDWVENDHGVFDKAALERQKYALIYKRASMLYLKLELMEQHASKKGERLKHIIRVCQSKMKE